MYSDLPKLHSIKLQYKQYNVHLESQIQACASHATYCAPLSHHRRSYFMQKEEKIKQSKDILIYGIFSASECYNFILNHFHTWYQI